MYAAPIKPTSDIRKIMCVSGQLTCIACLFCCKYFNLIHSELITKAYILKHSDDYAGFHFLKRLSLMICQDVHYNTRVWCDIYALKCRKTFPFQSTIVYSSVLSLKRALDSHRVS